MYSLTMKNILIRTIVVYLGLGQNYFLNMSVQLLNAIKAMLRYQTQSTGFKHNHLQFGVQTMRLELFVRKWTEDKCSEEQGIKI